MKKILFILIATIVYTTSFAQVKIGSDGGMHATGNYPVTYANENFAGLWSLKTITQRNAIPANFRDTGMLVFVKDSLKYYYLKNGITNGDWIELSSNGTGISKIYSSYGLLNVNDSTLKVDSAALITKGKHTNDSTILRNAIALKQNAFSNGTGFLRNNGSGTWSYDNNTYLSKDEAAASYVPYSGAIGDVNLGTDYSIYANAGHFRGRIFVGTPGEIDGEVILYNDDNEYFGSLKASVLSSTNKTYQFPNFSGDVLVYDNSSIAHGSIPRYHSTYGWQMGSEDDPIFQAHTAKNILNGTGFLRNNGSGTWSYDNNTYLTTSTAESTYLAKTDTTNKWMPKIHTTNSIANGTGFLKNNGSGTWSYDNNTYLTTSTAESTYQPKIKIQKLGSGTFYLTGEENIVFAKNASVVYLPRIEEIEDGTIIELGVMNITNWGDQYEVICQGADVFDAPMNCTNLYVRTVPGLSSTGTLSTKIVSDRGSGKWLVLQATQLGCY